MNRIDRTLKRVTPIKVIEAPGTYLFFHLGEQDTTLPRQVFLDVGGERPGSRVNGIEGLIFRIVE